MPRPRMATRNPQGIQVNAMNAYPQRFFIAHRLFTGKGFKQGGEWGDVGDGPIHRKDMVVAIEATFRGEPAPTLKTLHVWEFIDGVASDVTDQFIGGDDD